LSVEGIGVYHVGQGIYNYPVVIFDQSKRVGELVAYLSEDCERLKRLACEALPEYEIVSTWNGEGYTRFSVSMKPRENGQ